MIIVTSLSPRHVNQNMQISAVESWSKYGSVFSINTSQEIEQMKLIYGDVVTFVKSYKPVVGIAKVPLISINEIIDFAVLSESDLFYINSDIYLDSLPDLPQDGISIISRWDYTENFSDAKIFNPGFDCFHIPKKFLKLFPPCLFALGAAYHDYYLPLFAIKANIKVYWPQQRCAYHKLHETQYSVEDWLNIGEHFRWFFKFPKQINIGIMATSVLTEIKAKAIKI